MNDGILNADELRTRLAGERTLLAWVRTGLAMMGFGFVVARFGLFLREVAHAESLQNHQPVSFSLWIGTTLVLFGVVVNLLAAWEHFGFLWCLERNLPHQTSLRSQGIFVAVLLSIIGLVIVIYLVSIGVEHQGTNEVIKSTYRDLSK